MYTAYLLRLLPLNGFYHPFSGFGFGLFRHGVLRKLPDHSMNIFLNQLHRYQYVDRRDQGGLLGGRRVTDPSHSVSELLRWRYWCAGAFFERMQTPENRLKSACCRTRREDDLSPVGDPLASLLLLTTVVNVLYTDEFDLDGFRSSFSESDWPRHSMRYR